MNLIMRRRGMSGIGGNDNVPVGILNGKFAINSDGDQVYFSQGNLQYKASTNTWRFAWNQYDYIGSANGNISSTYNDYIDLFAWGTSGFDHGAVCYQPWSISTNISNYYAYGSDTYNLYDQTGQADWGYNAIINGGNHQNSGWRTLTKNEWDYLFKTRTTPSGIRYAKAIVNNVRGIILLPDDWDAFFYTLSNTNTTDNSFSDNTIGETEWATLEQHSAVFLPAAGESRQTSVYDTGSEGNYWSSSCGNRSRNARFMYFGNNNVGSSSQDRYFGMSVRLVKDVIE